MAAGGIEPRSSLTRGGEETRTLEKVDVETCDDCALLSLRASYRVTAARREKINLHSLTADEFGLCFLLFLIGRSHLPDPEWNPPNLWG